MKITSVIFLVVGLVISITGYILCGAAERMAKEAGEYDMLFEYNYDDEGNIVNEHEFSKDAVITTDAEGNEVRQKAVHKVSLTFSDMNIRVIGGAERSRIVFMNMEPLRYYHHISNYALYVSDVPSITNIIQSDSLQFDGLRRYLNTGKYKGKPQVVLYVSDADELKQYDFDLKNCTISLENLVGFYDMRLTAKNSTVTMQNCTTQSTLRLKLEDCKTTLSAVDYTETIIEGSGGNLFYDDTAIAYLFRYDISSEGGSLNLNGVDQAVPTYLANQSMEDYHSLLIAMTGTKLQMVCNG